jgi:hypothetical protein
MSKQLPRHFDIYQVFKKHSKFKVSDEGYEERVRAFCNQYGHFK